MCYNAEYQIYAIMLNCKKRVKFRFIDFLNFTSTSI